LVVCLHRGENYGTTASSILADVALTAPGAQALSPTPAEINRAVSIPAEPLIDRDEWMLQRNEALRAASARTVVAATTLARAAQERQDPGLNKPARDLDLPPWQKGRYGTAVGRAVHGVLQVIDLRTGDQLSEAAAAQCAAEGIPSRQRVVESLARSALGTSVAKAASAGQFWRELWVAAPIEDHLIEGYVDLLYREPDGLVIVDWKTDHVDDEAAIDEKLERYRLQGAAYAAAVEAATGEPVGRMVFVFLAEDGAIEVELDDLRSAVDEVHRTTNTLAELSERPDDLAAR